MNQNALLSSATNEQLYQICEKNGIDINYMQFTADNSYSYLGNTIVPLNGIVSVIALEWATDIGLKDYECPGLRDTYNLQITVRYQNNHPTETIDFDLYLITIIPGIFRIYDRSAYRIVGIINKQDVLNAVEMPGIDYESLEKRLLSGSSKFSKALKRLGKIGKKYGPKALKYGLPVVKRLAKAYAPEVAPFLEMIPGGSVVGGNYGGDMMNYGGKRAPCKTPKKRRIVSRCSSKALTAKQKKARKAAYAKKYRAKKKAKKGSSLVGGMHMTKRQLLNRLMDY